MEEFPQYGRTAQIRLQVKLTDNGICLADGTPLPRLKKRTFAVLVVPECFVEKDDRALLAGPQAHLLLAAGRDLFFVMRPRAADPHQGLWWSPSRSTTNGKYEALARIRLKEDLKLEFSLGTRGRLSPCRCTIPVLGVSAYSINHAYTLLSEHYEASRRSHTGNVFTLGRVYEGRQWRSLDDLRWCVRKKVAAEAEEAFEAAADQEGGVLGPGRYGQLAGR